MNTISKEDLNNLFLENKEAKENAKKYFGDKQPSMHEIGWYHPAQNNWSYRIGIVGIRGEGGHYKTEEGLIYGNGIQSGTTQYFEIVTQFGVVKAARKINIPELY